MSEQTANGRNANGHRFRLYEVIVGVVLTAMFALLTVMFGMLISSGNRTADQVAALDRKVDEKVGENSRQITEIRLLLVKMQTTLDLIASGLDIRVEPKAEEQAGPVGARTPNEKLATKDP